MIQAMTRVSRGVLLLLFFSLSLSAQNRADIRQTARDYLSGKLDEWQLRPADLSDVVISDIYTSGHNGLTHVYFIQRYAGNEIYNAVAGIHLDAAGRVRHATHRFYDRLADRVNATSPVHSAEKAMQSAAAHLGLDASVLPDKISQRGSKVFRYEGGAWSRSEIEVRLVYQPMPDGSLRLAWDMPFDLKASPDHWSLRVDARTGEVLDQQNYTVYCSFGDHGHSPAWPDGSCDPVRPPSWFSPAAPIPPAAADGATYRVFPVPVESPIHGPRQLIADPADSIASPFGWHDTNGNTGPEYTITRGNNAHAYLDISDLDASSGDEPDGGPDLFFDFPYDDAFEPTEMPDAAVTQLFYMNNFVHDFAYRYGFDEPAGNFQENNYGQGGLGNDAVNAEAQDGSGTNNANFATPPDGTSGRMQMFVWTTQPNRLVTINRPLDIAGTYEAGEADFGPSVNATPVTAPVAIALDGTNDANLVCEPVVNEEEVEGKIALVDRGGCFFEQKTAHAEAAGAVGVIICNFEEGVIGMSGVPEITNPAVPTVMLKSSDCQRIKAALSNDVEVEISLVQPNTTGPERIDGDFDNGIIAHEYGHGISNRLTGGPSQAGCLFNDEQMGEGWSDFFTLVTTVQPGDDGAKPRGIGNYAIRAGVDGGGIRRYPYSTDPAVNPQVYDDIIGTAAPHPLGEVWTAALWDMYWLLVDRYGFDDDLIHGTAGNNIAVQLVMDGMKLQACNPGFIDGRDAILQADEINYGGANRCLIWEAFARRGLGIGAGQGSSNDRNDGQQAFETLPACIQTLRVEKTTAPLIKAGEEMEVRLEVKNFLGETATNVEVSDLLPAGTELVAGSVSGAAVQQSGNQLRFVLDSLTQGQSLTVTYRLSTPEDQFSDRLFFDDMNSGDTNWDTESLEGQSAWGLDQFESETPEWIILDDGFENDQVLRLRDPIALTGDQPVLRFRHRYDTEPGLDGGFVQVSIDGGGQWQNLNGDFFRGGYRGKLAYSAFTIPFLDGFWGDSEGYLISYVDLSEFRGEEILVRFRFGTDFEEQLENTRDGWRMDDFEIMDMFNYATEACVRSDQSPLNCAAAEARGTIVEAGTTTSVAVLEEGGLDWSVFPNPASERVFINLMRAKPAETSLQLIGLDGRLLEEERYGRLAGEVSLRLDVDDLAPGMYLLRLQSGMHTETRKLVIR